MNLERSNEGRGRAMAKGKPKLKSSAARSVAAGEPLRGSLDLLADAEA